MAIETLHPQPYFPYEDLEDRNIPFVRYYLQTEASDQAYGSDLRGSLRMLHQTGHQALKILGIDVRYSQDEYNSFCAGFATFEYTARLLGRASFDDQAAVQKAKSLLIDNAFMADVEIAERFSKWRDSHPNLYGVILDTGLSQEDTMQ